MGDLIPGVNTLYMLFCFFKLFRVVGKGLKEGKYKTLNSLRRQNKCRLKDELSSFSPCSLSGYELTIHGEARLANKGRL